MTSVLLENQSYVLIALSRMPRKGSLLSVRSGSTSENSPRGIRKSTFHQPSFKIGENSREATLTPKMRRVGSSITKRHRSRQPRTCAPAPPSSVSCSLNTSQESSTERTALRRRNSNPVTPLACEETRVIALKKSRRARTRPSSPLRAHTAAASLQVPNRTSNRRTSSPQHSSRDSTEPPPIELVRCSRLNEIPSAFLRECATGVCVLERQDGVSYAYPDES